MAKTTVTKLYNASLNTPIFHMEDIFVTGMLSVKVRVRPVDNLDFFAFGISHWRTLDYCLLKQTISIHKVNLIEMNDMYDKLQASKNQDCHTLKSRMLSIF